MAKFFARKVYLHAPTGRTFGHLGDARDWCAEHGHDPAGIETFDSRGEYDRWQVLRRRERNGEISGLRRQVEFEIIPRQTTTVEAPPRDERRYYLTHAGQRLEFATLAEARRFARVAGARAADIERDVCRVPRFREVTVESAAHYTADFVYTDADGRTVVEDYKSPHTRQERDYVLRRKLMLFRHGIRVREQMTPEDDTNDKTNRQTWTTARE